MCRLKPYPRCSAHARARKERTAQVLAEVAAKHHALINNPEATEAQIEKQGKKMLQATLTHRKALDEYDECPEGLKKLEEAEETLRRQGNYEKATEVRLRRERAERRREEKVGRYYSSTPPSTQTFPEDPFGGGVWSAQGEVPPPSSYISVISRKGTVHRSPAYPGAYLSDHARATFGSAVQIRGNNTIVRHRADGTFDVVGFVTKD